MDVRRIAVGGLGVRVIEEAPARERDDPVLLIHGIGGWAETWAPVMPGIAASGRRAIAIDLPGFGESERPRRGRHFDPKDPLYAPFVLGALDALGIERAHVAGHSLGGAVAYTTAVWGPERIRTLTLVAPGGLGAALPPGFRFLTLPGMGLVARLRLSPRLTREALYSCFHDTSRCSADLLEQAARYGGPSVGEMVRVLRSSASFREGIRAALRDAWVARAERYRGPVLVVWGREDRVLPASLVEDARRIAPHAEVRLIPSCGHLVMAERPAALLDALVPFLERSVPLRPVAPLTADEDALPAERADGGRADALRG